MKTVVLTLDEVFLLVVFQQTYIPKTENEVFAVHNREVIRIPLSWKTLQQYVDNAVSGTISCEVVTDPDTCAMVRLKLAEER